MFIFVIVIIINLFIVFIAYNNCIILLGSVFYLYYSTLNMYKNKNYVITKIMKKFRF